MSSQWFRKRPSWRSLTAFLASLCLVLALAIPRIPAVAQITNATIVEILDGDEVFIEEAKATIDQIANFGEDIHTEDARAGIVFLEDLAVGRLAKDSVVTVGQCLEVVEGQLIASGPVNGCLSGFEADVSGTIYVMDADDDSTFKVLEGAIDVKPPSGDKIEVGQLREVSVEDDELEVKRIDFEDLVRILSGAFFNGFEVSLPNEERLIAICNEERIRIIEEADEAGPVVAARLPYCPTELGVRFDPGGGINLPF